MERDFVAARVEALELRRDLAAADMANRKLIMEVAALKAAVRLAVAELRECRRYRAAGCDAALEALKRVAP